MTMRDLSRLVYLIVFFFLLLALASVEWRPAMLSIALLQVLLRESRESSSRLSWHGDFDSGD